MEATYNYKVVRQFAIMTVVWGIVGMLVGVILSAQLIWPTLTEALGPLAPYLSYGRIRPLHTNAVIFAFGGCALFATSLYIVQRTCQTRLLSDGLAAFVFWGWQLIIVLAAVSLPLGVTSGKEYAELEPVATAPAARAAGSGPRHRRGLLLLVGALSCHRIDLLERNRCQGRGS